MKDQHDNLTAAFDTKDNLPDGYAATIKQENDTRFDIVLHNKSINTTPLTNHIYHSCPSYEIVGHSESLLILTAAHPKSAAL